MSQLTQWLCALAAGFILLGCGSQRDNATRAADTSATMDAVYALSKACRSLSTSDGRSLSVAADGYALGAGEAGAFRFQAAGLGQFLLLDQQQRLLSLVSPLDEVIDPSAGLLQDAGHSASGTMDVLNIVHPLVPVANALQQPGDELAGLGEAIDASDLGNTIGPRADPHLRSIWLLLPAMEGFTFQSASSAQWLAADDAGQLQLVATPDEALVLSLQPAQGCVDFPEADVAASGTPFGGELEPGVLFGFADTHVHLMASDRLGGKVIHGQAFHPLGVTKALDDCTIDHGPEGSLDGIGNFQRAGAPVGIHATDGWPSFRGWPVRDTLSHLQTYHVWVERAWRAGLRLMVNHFNADEALCHVAPRRAHGCDETETMRLQRAKLFKLQDYIDAQFGGPGQGWLRVVESPAQARQVIADGKLAVVMGLESSKPLACGEFMDAAECSREDIIARLDEFEALGIRSLFLAHWFDNALSGPGLFGPTELALNAFNKLETGHYYRVETCPVDGVGANQQSVGFYQDTGTPLDPWLNEAQAAAVPTYGPGPHCNALGLTDLGEFLVEEIMRRGLLIEFDHLSYNTKQRLLELAEQHQYPLIAGHLNTGGVTTTEQLHRLYGVGGLASPFNAPSPVLIERILAQQDFAKDDYFFGVAYASDSGGLAGQPPPREDVAERPLIYPFRSYDGQVVFERQKSGEREYDLNSDGVAHYGLYADLLADMAEQANGPEALGLMARAAEAYIRMWERARAHAQ